MKIELQTVESSFIRSAGFASDGRRDGLVLVAIGDNVYAYKGRKQAYNRLLRAKSVGEHYNKYIKPRPLVGVASVNAIFNASSTSI